MWLRRRMLTALMVAAVPLMASPGGARANERCTAGEFAPPPDSSIVINLQGTLSSETKHLAGEIRFRSGGRTHVMTAEPSSADGVAGDVDGDRQIGLTEASVCLNAPSSPEGILLVVTPVSRPEIEEYGRYTLRVTAGPTTFEVDAFAGYSGDTSAANGTQDGDLCLTSLDKAGAGALYP